MKRLFPILVFGGALLLAVGCSKYDDSALFGRLDDLEGRVARLEELCKQMNTNITSLQTLVSAVQNGDYVKEVTPVMQEGREIGYTITFEKCDPITIYHGTGSNTEGGGAMPVIGVRQDEDGIYYWTLNDEWLLDDAGNKIKAQGCDGKDGEVGRPGQDGTDGKPGQNGADGKDGITPQLKIESDFWFVSTDNGKTWTNLGKATTGGSSSDPMFQSIDYKTDNDYVIFTLFDGTQIKLPTWGAFEALKTLCNQMNTNISSLQTLVTVVQDYDYVKSVTPLMQDNKEVGYTITFGKSNPITIYHGKDGQDGKPGGNGDNGTPGQEGYTPAIGVKQDTDGIYYWTLDNDWLTDSAGNKIKAQGTDGQDGKPGTDGKPGQDGSNGTPGQDGITPKLKIENGYWYVSYDKDHQAWEQLDKATGESGAAGDSMFQHVTQDERNVYFTLASGVMITVPKTSGLSISFTMGNSLRFGQNETKTIRYTITGGGETNVVKAEMLNDDGGYTLHTTSTSATAGTIRIQAKTPTQNRVIISVSDGNHTIMAAIDVSSLALSFDGHTIQVETPGTLGQLLAGYNQSTITELTITGSINSTDIFTLADLSNLSVLDMENTDLTELPSKAFCNNQTLTSVKLPQALTTIGSAAFQGCTGLRGNLTIPSGVTTIEASAFAECSLTSVTIPNGVTKIGSAAFGVCSGLTNVTIPESVTEIGDGAFMFCTGLTSLTIPNSVTTIGEDAFYGCTGLTTIYCQSNTPTQLGYSVFYNVPTSTCVLYVPTGCVEAYRTAEGWKRFKNIMETEF